MTGATVRTLAAIVLAGLFLLGAAYIIGGRYTLHVGERAVVRLDRFSGEVRLCQRGTTGKPCGRLPIDAPIALKQGTIAAPDSEWDGAGRKVAPASNTAP